MTRRPSGSHRPSRHSRRRQRRLRDLWVTLSLLLVSGAFGAGYYFWLPEKEDDETAQYAAGAEPNPQQRAEALRLVDRAVTARHGELTNEAVRLAVDARKRDPTVPGAALFFAEMALRNGAMEVSSAAALEALRQDEYAGDARLLLALTTWMRRGQTGTEEAGRSSTQMLAEAAEAELANNQVRFFAGDLLRIIGKPAEAQANLLGSLHRQQVWDSAALLAAKLRLTPEEGPTARDIAVPEPGPETELFATRAAEAARILQQGGEPSLALGALQEVFTARQTAQLRTDPALATPAGIPAAEPEAKRQPEPPSSPDSTVGLGDESGGPTGSPGER